MKKEILKIDLDIRIDNFGWIKHYKRAVKAALEKYGYEVKRVVVRESPSGRGLHIWLHIRGKPLTEEKRNLLQFLCYDDQVRVWIGQKRLERGISTWNKLFDHVIWKRKAHPKYLMRLKKKQLVDMYGKLIKAIKRIDNDE